MGSHRYNGRRPLSPKLIRFLRRRRTTWKLESCIEQREDRSRPPTCSHKIEFSFLNGNLVVPAGHPPILRNVTTNGLTLFAKETSMKTLITTLALASLVATSTVAEIVHTTHVDRGDIYQSDSLGHQSGAGRDAVGIWRGAISG